jgi:LmbE family N-acetylglucosaminyl deacetylase
MKVLAVMSHPDDAEVWSGGTLAKYVGHGHSAHIVVMTYGDGDRRGEEAREGAERLGCTLELLGNKDTYLRDTDSAADQVLDVFFREIPQVLIVHNPDDTHPDHEASFRIASRALIRWYVSPQRPSVIPSVFAANSYQGMGKSGPLALDTFVDISTTWSKKHAALMAHRSQGPDRWIDALRVAAEVLGARSGCAMAEGFRRLVLFNEPGTFFELDPGPLG